MNDAADAAIMTINIVVEIDVEEAASGLIVGVGVGVDECVITFDDAMLY